MRVRSLPHLAGVRSKNPRPDAQPQTEAFQPQKNSSRELSMNNIGILMILLHAHPHLYLVSSSITLEGSNQANLSKCTQSRKNTATNPSSVFPLWRSKDFDAHVFDSKPLHFGQ